MGNGRPRQLALCLAALAGGAGLAVAVASAGADAPMSAGITAKDPYSFDDGNGGSAVTIATGGTVSFGYPTGSNTHNVVFGASKPTSCTDLPESPSAPGWSGSCTFDTPGTYSFHCGLHTFMTGKVDVVDPNAPTTGTTDPSPTETGGSPTNTNPVPGYGSPGGGESSPAAVKVARRQQGTVVHGSVSTPAGPSRIAVTAFAAKKVLAPRPVASRVRLLKVGALKKRSAGTGRTSFALRVNRTARRALHRRGRLTVSLRVVITPDVDIAVRKTMSVVLRERP